MSKNDAYFCTKCGQKAVVVKEHKVKYYELKTGKPVCRGELRCPQAQGRRGLGHLLWKILVKDDGEFESAECGDF